MSWDITFHNAPQTAKRLDELPEPPVPLGSLAQVQAALANALPEAWFEGEGEAWWGGLYREGEFDLRIHLVMAEDGPVPRPVDWVCFQVATQGSDPYLDRQHPIWEVIAEVCHATGWRPQDDGEWFFGADGRPTPKQVSPRKWWQFWR